MWQELLDEERWLQQVSSDREASLIGRWTQVSFKIVCANREPVEYSYDSGKLSQTQSPSAVDALVFKGSLGAWVDFLRETPAPPNNHFLGMQRRRDDFAIDSLPEYIRHLRVLTRVFEIARECRRNAEATT